MTSVRSPKTSRPSLIPGTGLGKSDSGTTGATPTASIKPTPFLRHLGCGTTSATGPGRPERSKVPLEVRSGIVPELARRLFDHDALVTAIPFELPITSLASMKAIQPPSPPTTCCHVGHP